MLRLSLVIFIFSFNSFAELSDKEKFLNQFRKEENKVVTKQEQFKRLYEKRKKEQELRQHHRQQVDMDEQKRVQLLEELNNHPDFDVIGADKLPYGALLRIKEQLESRGMMDQRKKDAYIKKVKKHNQENKDNQIELDEVDPELTNSFGMGGGAPNITLTQEELENPIKMPPEKVEQYLQQSYRQMDPMESRSLLASKFKGKPFISSEKFVFFMDSVIREPYAIADAMGVIKNRSKIGLYIGFLVLSYFIGVFYKKVQEAKELEGMQKTLGNITRSLVMNALRFAIFLTFFGGYLKRTWGVFTRVFL